MIEKQFFLVKPIRENDIIDFFKNKLDLLLDSINYPKPDAKLFLQYLNYSGDIKVSINISCSNDNRIKSDDYNIATVLAKSFNTEVIFSEINNEGKEKWILVNSDKKYFQVEIFDENEEIYIDRNSLIPYHI